MSQRYRVLIAVALTVILLPSAAVAQKFAAALPPEAQASLASAERALLDQDGAAAEREILRVLELAPDYAEAHYNLAVFYLQRNPPAVELARRHYYKSVDLGGAPDPEIEKKVEAK